MNAWGFAKYMATKSLRISRVGSLLDRMSFFLVGFHHYFGLHLFLFGDFLWIVVKHKEFVRSNNLQVKIEIT